MLRTVALLALFLLSAPGCNRADKNASGGSGTYSICGCDGLFVLTTTPTNGQEVRPDLSDPGLNRRFTMKLSSTPRRGYWLGETREGRRTRLERHDGAPVDGSWEIDEATRSVVFQPAGDLPPGQYTVTVRSR